MGTIKLRRGTGSPAGSLAQYEVAMDVANTTLYTSTDGSDAVILSNNTQEFLENNTISGITTETATYSEISKFSRINNTANYTISCLEVEREFGSSDPATGLDQRGAGFTFTIKSDNYNDIYPGGFYGKSGGKDQSAGVENTVGMSTYGGAADSYAEYTIFEGNRNQSSLFQNTVIEGSATNLTTPVLHLKTDNSNWFAGQLMCSDSNGKVFTQVGRHNTGSDNYQWNITLDPDNNDSPSGAFAGDYFVSFEKDYTVPATPVMRQRVFGAKGGFEINVHDDYNSGSPNPGPLPFAGYGWKPIVYNVESFEVKVKDSDTSVASVLTADDTKIEAKRPVVLGSETSDPTGVDGMMYYNTTTNQFRIKANGLWGDVDSTVTSTTLAALTDVDITSPANGQALVYNSATSKWENATASTNTVMTMKTKVQLGSYTGTIGEKVLCTDAVWDNTLGEWVATDCVWLTQNSTSTWWRVSTSGYDEQVEFNLINIGECVNGQTYTIKDAYGSDFTLIGAANNNAGTVFTATGPGTGNGQCYT